MSGDRKEPVFRHLDDADVPWQQVKRQRNADGSESSVWEKWLAFSPDPQYLSLYARYDAGSLSSRPTTTSPTSRPPTGPSRSPSSTSSASLRM